MNKISETKKHRHLFLPYISGCYAGVDIGYGGDPILDTAITIDLKERYTNVGDKPQHLYGDASKLYWFNDNVLDYVYSSHLIEDFEDTLGVLNEWMRVIKPGGFLCLLFPDEQRYRQIEASEYWNKAHKHLNMGLEFMLNIIFKLNFKYRIVKANELFNDNDYNCIIILQKL